ncbi:MAG: SufS family cysteine desulfurase [Myxococcota bacterium]
MNAAGLGVDRAARALADGYDVDAVRAQFPILSRTVNDRPLVYLDSAASAQKPLAVIHAIDHYLRHEHANVHRGIHTLSAEATVRYEAARAAVARFVGAPSPGEVVFTRGTTEAVNLVAASYGARLVPGDELVVSAIEHHSNIVPWQLLAARSGARLRVAPVTDDGSLDWDGFVGVLSDRTKLVSMTHVSNALGTVFPVRRIADAVHDAGGVLLVDGAQGAVHLPIDVTALGCDFYAFSGHKVYGPTGIGALWGKAALLADMPPWQGGGEMIARVSFDGTTFADPPARFEAGTPAIAEAIGLGVAVDWLDALGRPAVAAYERELLAYGTAALSEIPGLRLIGTSPDKASILGFVIDGVHPQDLATLLDEQGIAVRTGHHCAEPAMTRFGVTGTVRASLGCYTTGAELDALVAGIRRALRILGPGRT